MLDPKRFAEILRDPDDPRWQEAFERLLLMMRRYVRGGKRWPRIQESGTLPDRDLAQELAHDFWLRLKENPRALDAAVIRGYGAVAWEIVRFLRTPTLQSIEVSESRLKEHFASKVREIVRRGDYRELRRNFWGLSDATERIATAEELEHVRIKQPALPSDWSPQRSNQDPPVANTAALTRHVNLVLRSSGAFCWIGDLCEICWAALTPPLSAALPHTRTSAAVDQTPAMDSYRDFELPILLQKYFDTLDGETRNIARLAYGEGGSSIREIEAQTSGARTTIARKLKAFQTGLSRYLTANGYTPRDMDALREALRDILSG